MTPKASPRCFSSGSLVEKSGTRAWTRHCPRDEEQGKWETVKEVAQLEPGLGLRLAPGKLGERITTQGGFHPEAKCPGLCPLVSASHWLQGPLRDWGV